MVSTYRIAINRDATGKLPQGDPRWATFNDNFENVEIEPLEFANAIYNGHAYTTWHNGRRNLENFICGQHLAIDLDTEDERSSIGLLLDHPLIYNYASFIHTTPTHSADAPRSRPVFLLDEPITDAAGYTAATNFLMSQFDGADTVCKDASRFFYGAKDCEIEWVGNVLPVGALRTLYRQWMKAHPTWNARTAPANIVPMQRVEEVRQRRHVGAAVGDNDELEKVRQALAVIDPWTIDYNKWFKFLAALHDDFGDAALPIAEAWAQGKPGEVRRKWNTIGNYAGPRATIASIFAEANQRRAM